MFRFHQFMNLSRLILMNTIRIATGIMDVKTMFIGNGKYKSKKRFKKNSKTINIGTITAQKIPEEALSIKLAPGTFKIDL